MKQRRFYEGMRVRLTGDVSWSAVGMARGDYVVPAGTIGTVTRKEYFMDATMWAVDWDNIPSEAQGPGGPVFCGLGNGSEMPDWLEEITNEETT